MPTELYIAYAVIAVAVLVILDQIRRALGWLPAKEKPERILGKEIIFSEIEGLGQNPLFLTGVVVSHNEDEYKIELTNPFPAFEKKAQFAKVSGRWVGVPISGAGRWQRVPVNGKLDSGEEFLALVKLQQKVQFSGRP